MSISKWFKKHKNVARFIVVIVLLLATGHAITSTLKERDAFLFFKYSAFPVFAIILIFLLYGSDLDRHVKKIEDRLLTMINEIEQRLDALERTEEK